MSIIIKLPEEMVKEGDFILIKNQITEMLRELYPDMDRTHYSGDTIFICKNIDPNLRTHLSEHDKEKLKNLVCSDCGSHDLEFIEYPVEYQRSPTIKCKKCGKSGV